MVAPLQLPRAEWSTHPNYPRQVLLLGSHRNFRAMGRLLIDRASGGQGRASTLAAFSWWKSAMGGHEHYEEHKLYPFLEHRWGLDCTLLRDGHTALSTADAQVRQAQGTPALVSALEAHHSVLLQHLDEEEQLVVPALLALAPWEFDAYTSQSLWRTMLEVPCHAGEAGCRVCVR